MSKHVREKLSKLDHLVNVHGKLLQLHQKFPHPYLCIKLYHKHFNAVHGITAKTASVLFFILRYVNMNEMHRTE